MGEVEEILEHWREQPPIADVLRAHFPVRTSARAPVASTTTVTTPEPREVSEDEFKALLAESQTFVARHGRAG